MLNFINHIYLKSTAVVKDAEGHTQRHTHTQEVGEGRKEKGRERGGGIPEGRRKRSERSCRHQVSFVTLL